MSNPATTACPTDEELIPLLAGETAGETVESHLRGCTVCQSRLDIFRSDLAALRSVSSLDGVAPVATPASTGRPSRIGKYLVVGELDSGGQAHVYRAVHPTLDKELAIKLSRRAVGRSSDHRPLLVAEGKLLAKLDHPNLARIYDLDFHDDLPFLAMEYVRGPNLRQFAADNPVPPRQAAGFVAQVARALAEVHRHGVVHQDVKPHNILIDEDGRPRLIDFGLARLRHAWDDAGENPSGGTPAFMAPEQARGESAAVGPRSDVFALGGVLYFLLAGKAPFQAATVVETLKLAGRCEFDRPALDKPGIPRGLRAVCLKAMAANPADRYAGAGDMADALERYLTRPRRVARLAIGVAAVGLLAATAYAAWSLSRPATVSTVPNPPPAAEPSLDVLVSRGDRTLDLKSALPLVPARDRVQVVARVPAGHPALLLHVNGKGEVKRLDPRESPADGYARLVFPADGALAHLEPGVPGTEVVLLCAAEKAENLAGIEELVRRQLADLPPMKPQELVFLTGNEPTRKRDFGVEEPEGAAVVELKLDRLRVKLREKNLSVIRGVAYPR